MDKVSIWKDELAVLRSIVEKTTLVKTIKWGGEIYTYNGKNVLGLAGFKNYFALWFYNGVFLKDRHTSPWQKEKKRNGKEWKRSFP